MKFLLIVGTRPEAIKMSSVCRSLRAVSGFETEICFTGQHQELVSPMLDLFQMKPKFTLASMKPGQSLSELTSSLFQGISSVITEYKPDGILVQGDTTSVFVGGVCGFYQKIPVFHVEAGLRTGDLTSPFPEEANRRLVSEITSLHFAPTEGAKLALLNEGFKAETVEVTGNTGIDATHLAVRALEKGEWKPKTPAPKTPFILVTLHRRESQATGITAVSKALDRISEKHGLPIIFPVHLNPQVRDVVFRELSPTGERIQLVEPMDYASFMDHLRSARIIVTDSGGIQEEATALGKAIVIARDNTERPEVLNSPLCKIAGTTEEGIVQATEELLSSRAVPTTEQKNSFGDGQASERIVKRLRSYYENLGRITRV
ncbi:MAG: UDP-N-acetylglucosamine 2-epimerase (non-hydrolyzing) [Xanthomonadaceae bacterium]|nr:UDP-N-acetylglucosamine 2-epimerase (non-hydrolyzing) [Xanthomonadaceae bacterium]